MKYWTAMGNSRCLTLVAGTQFKYVKGDIKSGYKYVNIMRKPDNTPVFVVNITRKDIIFRKSFDTEREAAIAADMALIKHGLPPVNILKKL